MKRESYSSKNFVLFVCLTVLVVLALVGNLLIKTKVNVLSLPSAQRNSISLLQSEDKDSSRKQTQTYVAKPPVKTCIGVKLIVLIKSAPNHFEQRRIIRNTWASVHNVSGNLIRTFFLLGVTGNRTTNLLLTKEASAYDDVIVGPFIDSYLNLTLKSSFGLRWIREFCSETRFVLLGDDDVYLKLPMIATRYLSTSSREKVLHCGVQTVKRAKSHLDMFRLGVLVIRVVKRKGKWNIPFAYYKSTFYPPYCKGPCFIMSIDVVLSISLALNVNLTRITVDDALLSGIIREQVRCPLSNMPKKFCSDLENTEDIKQKLNKAWEKDKYVLGLKNTEQ